MITVLYKLRSFYGIGKKLAVFWDNASYHRSPEVLLYANDPEIDIRIIRNVPYRPDFNGIELLWRSAKITFYKLVDSMRALGGRSWD